MDFQKVDAVIPLKRSALAERSDDELMQIGVFGVVGLADLASVSVQLAVPTFRKKLEPSTVAAGVGRGLAARVMDLSTERLLRLYRADPGLQVGFDVAPVDGGATVGRSGRY